MRIYLALAVLAAMLSSAPAMAQFVTTPYGNNGMMVTPYNGTTSGYQTNPPPMQTFIVPNAQLQQQVRPNFCAGFSNAYGQTHC